MKIVENDDDEFKIKELVDEWQKKRKMTGKSIIENHICNATISF